MEKPATYTRGGTIRGTWGVLLGFLLSGYFQSELRSFVTPRIEVPFGDILGATRVYSFAPSVEFAIFGAIFLVLAAVVFPKRKHLAVGMAACAALDLVLLLGGGILRVK
jgi:hypothetical protein